MRCALLIALSLSVSMPVMAQDVPAKPVAKPAVKTTTSAPKLAAGTGVAKRTAEPLESTLKPGEKLADDVAWPKWPTAEARGGLVELSKWLGQAHFLRVLCTGRSDQSWREKMQVILDRDARSDEALRAQMIEGFNSGYTVLEGDYTSCVPEIKEVEAETFKKAAGSAATIARMARGHLKAVAELAAAERTKTATAAPDVRR
jgi:uncharacterized protein (TIGR02301 family)